MDGKMVISKKENAFFTILGFVISICLVNSSSLLVYSYGTHIIDAIISLATFVGIRKALFTCFKFFKSYKNRT